MAQPWQAIFTLIVGLATGVLSGMFGVGGAVLSTPAIRVLGATPFEAVGSTIPSIFPSAISGTLRYQREGLVDWRIVAWTGGTGSIAAIIGSMLSHAVPGDGHWLMVATAGLVGIVAWGMAATGDGAAPSDPAPASDAGSDAAWDETNGSSEAQSSPPAQTWRVVLIGVGAGGLSGLLGLGGGIVMVPGFTQWLRLPIKRAIGTSLAAVALLSVPSTVSHALLGDINWGFAIPLSIAVIPGARIGAHLALRSSERRLRLTVAIVLAIVAVSYAGGELLSLMS